MLAPNDTSASPGRPFLDDELPRTAQDCNRLTAEGFIGMGGFNGSGGFRPPDLEFAAHRNACLAGLRARQQKTTPPLSQQAQQDPQGTLNWILVLLTIIGLIRSGV